MVHFAVRALMHETTLKTHVDPDELSFRKRSANDTLAAPIAVC
jgi:hypothetical protein